MTGRTPIAVRLERQPQRNAIMRLREAYGYLSHADGQDSATGVLPRRADTVHAVQEVTDEPACSPLCAGLDAPAEG